MSDPRAILAFDGIDDNYTTYAYDSSIVYDATKPDGSASAGLAVTMTAAQTVGLAADAQGVVGRLTLVENDGKCSVQTEGYCKLPGGTSATLTVGSKIVGALNGGNKGYIRSMAPATLAEVAAATATEIVDATDPTNVVVVFD